MGQNLFSVPPSEEKVVFVFFWMGFQVGNYNSVVFKAKCKHKEIVFSIPCKPVLSITTGGRKIIKVI